VSRDINGNYTLPPVVNPVVAATTITVTWANSTLTDVAAALTDSLSRSGAGGMTAPLRLIDGTAVAPALSFSAESTTGLYRIGSSSVGLSLSGITQYRFNVGAMDIWNGSAWEAVATTTAYGQTLLDAVDAPAARTVLGATIVNKNRFANGAFVFDQRNAGGAFSVVSGPAVRTLDCFLASGSGTGAFTVQQIVGIGGPTGSAGYVRMAVTTADATMAATDQYQVLALIEGFDIADLGFGAAGAQPISIGFWFRSSITGTFSGSVRNAAANRSYVISWTYATANTWQFVTLPNIPGDTSGVWPNNNVLGMTITVSLGAGTNFSGTPGSWTSTTTMNATGATNLISTLGATMDLALFQVEAGPVCTPFEWLPYQAGLARVRRYFRIYRTANGETNAFSWAGQVGLGNGVWTTVHFDTPMRASPTVDLAGAVFNFNNLGTPTVQYTTPVSVTLQFVGTFSGGGSANITSGQVTVAVEL
jgi:hypothetical protein